MRFTAVTSTDDGRLTAGKVYDGGFTSISGGLDGETYPRIIVFDNLREWMTFSPKVFVPVGEYIPSYPTSGAQ